MKWLMGKPSLVIGLLLIGAGIAAWQYSDQWRPIERLTVTAPFERVGEAQIKATVGPLAEVGFFAVDLDEVKDSLQQLTWVAEAEVRRVWPDELVIALTEHQPLAIWNRRQLLTAGGDVVLMEQMGQPRGLPLLEGPEDEAIAAWNWYREIQLTAPDAAPQRLLITPRAAVTAWLANGLELRLGRTEIKQRWRNWLAAMNQLPQPLADIAYVDLRYSKGMAVNWRPGRKPQQQGDQKVTGYGNGS